MPPPRHLFAIALMALSLGQATAADPSFDCAEAQGQVERLICDDADLAALDRALAAAYDRALELTRDDGYEDPHPVQRRWIKGRDDCWKAADVRGCAETSYKHRIAELQIQYGDLVVPEAVNYRCGDLDLAVVFYGETDPPTAVLTPIGAAGPDGPGQVIAFLSRSGSGSRYEGQNLSF